MERSSRRGALLAAVLTLVVAGCGGETATGTPTPAATPPPSAALPTSAPAASPTPGHTPSPTPTPVVASPSPSPTATATATVTARPTVVPSPSPTSALGRSVYVAAGSRSSNAVALTLDFGGRVGDALAIVRYLADRGVPATVFSTGAQADLAAGDAVVRQVFEVVCAPGGLFAIGNHSMTHPDFATLRPKQMREELAAAEAAIDRACPGRSPRPLFRPPFGSLGGWQTATFYRILDAVGAAGYSRTVAWDVDTLDWAAPGTDRHQTAAQIVARVQAKVRGGSIVLMHLGGYETYDALRILVPWLRGQGFELVTLAEMPGL